MPLSKSRLPRLSPPKPIISLPLLLCAYIKLELLKGDTRLNHFALKSKLYLRAIQSAYAALRELSPAQLAA